jgi:hypothetical protein
VEILKEMKAFGFAISTANWKSPNLGATAPEMMNPAIVLPAPNQTEYK